MLLQITQSFDQRDAFQALNLNADVTFDIIEVEKRPFF
jgi:hypothetical protein